MTRVVLLPVFATVVLLAACDVGTPFSPPPGPPPPAQTRVVRLTLDPDTVAVGDTTLIHVVIEDSLDASFRYDWGIREELLLPVEGRFDGPRIQFVAPRTSQDPGRVVPAISSVRITNDVPGTRGVTYSFAIPIRN